ncbi:MAG: DUF1080 domain-containing protein [Verrucomicrobia subdivision 3 bacterium]|nr:DUF1080 domain-containing protein [Limisphaerales bacterium]
MKMICLLGVAGAAVLFLTSDSVAAQGAEWKSLFNGKDLSGWDTWLGPKSGGYHDPKKSKEAAIGLNTDPLGVFTVVEKDGAPAIRVSGQVFGAITTHEEFRNIHIRVEYKWGEKKWPPREKPKHYRDSGILYWCVGEHGAGSYAWMRSVECNIMEKGVGQWWSVAGSYVDIEGKKVVLEKELSVPYRGESPGEQCIVYMPGGPQFTTGEGITSSLDPEKPGEWNVCEVIAWGNVSIHISNGKVVLALVNPRYKEGQREIALTRGKIQLQSEGAELFYRRIEVRPIDEIPAELLSHVPRSAPDEKGFVSLLGKNTNDGWAQCGPGRFEVENGIASAQGGMGLWWHTNRTYTNFVLRGEFVQEQPAADSGIFFRFPNPGNDPWVAVKRGHEVEIGDEKAAKPTWWTGSIYPFHAPAVVNVKPAGQWNEFEIVAIGHNYSVRLNGQLVNTWTDKDQRSASGYVGLQNYNDDKTVRFRNLRIKDLP